MHEAHPVTFILPAVIDALVLALAPLKAGGVFVLDGPLPQWPKEDAVVIGIGQGASATQQLPRENRMGGPVGYRETARVICGLYSWTVDDDPTPEVIKTRRDVATGLFESVRDVLDADPTLGGVCTLAEFADSVSMLATNDGDGARVSIGFAIDAYRVV